MVCQNDIFYETSDGDALTKGRYHFAQRGQWQDCKYFIVNLVVVVGIHIICPILLCFIYALPTHQKFMHYQLWYVM